MDKIQFSLFFSWSFNLRSHFHGAKCKIGIVSLNTDYSYLSFNFIFMNFVTGPLIWPLVERCKQRPSLRECTILLRKSMNIYGTLMNQSKGQSLQL